MWPNNAFHEWNRFPHSVQGAMALLLKTEARLGFGFLFIGLHLRGMMVVVPCKRREEGAELEGREPLKGEQSMDSVVMVSSAT